MQRIALAVVAVAALVVAWAYLLRTTHLLFRRESVLPKSKSKQVQLVDLLAIFVLVMPPLSFLSAVRDTSNVSLPHKVLFGGLLVALFVGMWWRGVEMLSILSVEDGRRRFVFLAFLLPGLLVGGLFAGVALLVSPAALMAPTFPFSSWLPITFATAVGGAMVGLGNRWVLAGATDVEAPLRLKEPGD